MKYVVNREGNDEIIGPYVGTDEDTVFYADAAVNVRRAPADCVEVVEISYAMMKAAIEGMARRVLDSADEVGGSTTAALNGLVLTAVEMIEYAQVMGAALSLDAAWANLRRREKDGWRVGTRAHVEPDGSYATVAAR